MHKSYSVSRQGTFDTGPATPDKRGSIRRGDIELPIVGDFNARVQNATETAQDQDDSDARTLGAKWNSPDSAQNNHRDSDQNTGQNSSGTSRSDPTENSRKVRQNSSDTSRNGPTASNQKLRQDSSDPSKNGPTVNSQKLRQDSSDTSRNDPTVSSRNLGPDSADTRQNDSGVGSQSPTASKGQNESGVGSQSPTASKGQNDSGVGSQSPTASKGQNDSGVGSQSPTASKGQNESGVGSQSPTASKGQNESGVGSQSPTASKGQNDSGVGSQSPTASKGQNDSGVGSQSSTASKGRPASSATGPAVRLIPSREPSPTHADDEGEDSPRYVDHNKLFPQPALGKNHEARHGREDRASLSELSDEERRGSRDARSDSLKALTLNASVPKTPRADPNTKVSINDKGRSRHAQQQGNSVSTGDGLNRAKAKQGQKEPGSISRSPSQEQKASASSPGGSAETNTQQTARTNALARLRGRRNSVIEKQATGGQTRHAVHEDKKATNEKERPPVIETVRKNDSKATSSEEKAPSSEKVNDSISNSVASLEPSSPIVTENQTSPQQHSQPTSLSVKQNKPPKDFQHQQKQTVKVNHANDNAGQREQLGDTPCDSISGCIGPLAASLQGNFHNAYLGSASIDEQDTVVPSQTAPVTHDLKDDSSNSKILNNEARDRPSSISENQKTLTPSRTGQSKCDIPKSKNSLQSSSPTSISSGTAQSPSAMATTTEAPRRAGGDSEVTLERDQLLRNERTYKQRILQLEDEVKSVVRQSQELSAENRLLQNKVEAFETKAYGGSLEVKELRREKQDLMAMVSKTTGEKQQADIENERLQAKLSEMDSKSKQWDSLYVENNKLKTKQAELEKRVSDVEKEKQKLQNSLKTAESSQLDKLAAVQNENKKIQADLINLQTKNNSLERKVERLQGENKELCEMLDKKKDEVNELMKAMKTETNVEMELKEAKTEIEFAKSKMADFKKDLDEVNHRYEVLEKEKDSAKNALRLKESEFKGLKANTEEKDTQIGELKRQVDAAKRNVKRLEDDLEDTKQVEKDAVGMKARIRSLKNEIEDSLASNHKMKQERTEARLEADRLNRELAGQSEAVSEARRYIKKLEGERASRDKLEDDVKARMKREQELENQAFDLNLRNETLRKKVRELEEDKAELLKNRSVDLTEIQSLNRKLLDENKKLRQMLVERNMEMVQNQSDRNVLVNRVDSLERKQNDSEIKVQQIKGWVDNVHASTALPAATHQYNSRNYLALPPVKGPSVNHRLPHAESVDRGHRTKAQPRPQQLQWNHLNRSWADMKRMSDENEESLRTTPSLPVVLEPQKVTLTHNVHSPGYCDLYRNKLKLNRERKW